MSRCLPWLAALAALAALPPTAADGPVICDRLPTAAPGGTFRWPQPNPAMVAPVTATFFYPNYNHPLASVYTGGSFEVTVPPDFVAGFNLTDSRGTPTERYVLTSMEVKLPGLVPDGLAQVPNRVFELVLLHKETTGKNYWAKVVVPIEVTSDPGQDVLTPLFAGTRRPQVPQESINLLVAGTTPLDLSAAWTNAQFSTFWTVLPTDCSGYQASTRVLMRRTALATVQSTFAVLLDAFSKNPKTAAAEPPQATFLLAACPAAQSCTLLQPADLADQLNQALAVQSRALAQFRSHKDRMDQALVLLRNMTDESYDLATAARDNLRSAESELASAKAAVAQLQAWQRQAAARWDASAPAEMGFELQRAEAPAAQGREAPEAATADSGGHSEGTTRGPSVLALLHEVSAAKRSHPGQTGVPAARVPLTSRLLERAARDGAQQYGKGIRRISNL